MNVLPAVAAHPSTALMPSLVTGGGDAPRVVAGGGVGSAAHTVLRLVLIAGGIGAGLLLGGALGAVVGLAAGAIVGAAILSHKAAQF